MYKNVNPENQDFFHNLVVESNKQLTAKHGEYYYPKNKEVYWAIVNEYWEELSDIVLRFVPDANQKELDDLKNSKDAFLTHFFQDAWKSSPDDGKIHLIPAWGVLCDLCSEIGVLYE